MPTGVAVDSNGKVWVTNYNSDNVMRIDPTSMAVDLTIDLGSNANPYNYSDMTGTVITGTTQPTGFWSVTEDSGILGQIWDQIFWNTEAEGFIPADGGILVEARAADTIAGLVGGWTSYLSGDFLGLTGQYLQIRATLTRGASGISPILSDVSVTAGGIPEPASFIIWFGFGAMMVGCAVRRKRR
jgi:hypothetical protein